jgi:hypothetical protein
MLPSTSPQNGAAGDARSPTFRFTGAALCLLSYSGETSGVLPLDDPAEAGGGIEPPSPDLGASGGSRTLVAGVALQNLTVRPHPRTFGAEYGSPTRLTGLEDQHLKRSANPARTYFEPEPQLPLSKIKWSGTSELNRVHMFPRHGCDHYTSPRKTKRPGILSDPGRLGTPLIPRRLTDRGRRDSSRARWFPSPAASYRIGMLLSKLVYLLRTINH